MGKAAQLYDEEDDDVIYDDDEEDELMTEVPKSKKGLMTPPPIQPIQPKTQPKREKEVEPEPQVIQIPRIVSIEEMLNILYEQQIQILSLLRKNE
jgi:hypothetical protein